MTIAEDFLLLATEPNSGKYMLSSMISDITLGGATLVDLIEADRVELTGEKSKARVVLTDNTPIGNPVLDRSITMLQSKGPMRPQTAVSRLGKKSKVPLYEALAARGFVQRKNEKVLGLFPVTRWPLIDTVRRDNLLQLIASSLVHGMDATGETGPLIGLLAASNKLQIVVDKPELKAAKARAKVIAEGDWASEAVRKAIQASMNTVMLAAVAASSAGSGSS